MSKRVQQFGGKHTEAKQDAVMRYLHSYATALRRKFVISYIDAFAGCGWRLNAGTNSKPLPAHFTHGLFGPLSPPAHSLKPKPNVALQALWLRPRFNRYVYGDKSAAYLNTLRRTVEELRAGGANLPMPEFFHGDANDLGRDLKQPFEVIGVFAS